MKRYTKNIFTALFMLMSMHLTVAQQQVNNLYFIENAPVRHYLNPAFQPLSNFYLGFPVLGYSQFGFGNNSFTVSSLNTSKDKLFNSLRPTTLLSTQEAINILDFGFRSRRAYLSFGITTKISAYGAIPKDFIKLLMYGNAKLVNGEPLYTNTSFDFKSLTAGADAYTEVALGYSRIINDQWTVGGKLKYLHGIGTVKTTFSNLDLVTGIDEWNLNGKGVIQSSLPGTTVVGNDLQSIDQSFPSKSLDFIKPAGVGGGIDLGVTYQPIKSLTFAAAVTDLGFIRWTKNTRNVSLSTDYSFTGVGQLSSNQIFDGIDSKELLDSIGKAFKNATTTTNTNKAFTTSTSPKINASVEYGVLKDAISVGLLSSTMFHESSVYQDVTASLNLRPANWFNMALSYSILNGRGSNLGLGLGFRLGFINAFFTTDYIPVRYTKIPYSAIGLTDSDLANVNLFGSQLRSTDKVTLPYKTDRMNFAFGFNFVFGNRQDKDRDGVKDKWDECPNTPRKVEVDKKGCPVDVDKDGVPDYLDRCPDTPQGATVDENGCPLDTDKDGVPDYLDKCPDTPKEAYGRVDSVGCPLDTDNDGVFDYLDRCPDTPQGAPVDSVGCPLDTDKDGVPDYLDKCPDTPNEAYGKVDASGCPLDTDKDGVPDYMDKCPNTLSGVSVDSVGCPLDTDKDGVPDYMDKCPNTPKEAVGMVDSVGCPLDTDGDGVFDYMDNCPKLAGSRTNKGCPELKKEVRTLFQKALQGIQFETGKSVIKKVSFTILDQIAKTLVDNPTYKIEVQGHTDNVGNKDLNMKLSQSRADAVRKYLIDKGIDDQRVTSKGFGDTVPVVPNNSAKNKAKNRRVQFEVSFEEVKIVNE